MRWLGLVFALCLAPGCLSEVAPAGPAGGDAPLESCPELPRAQGFDTTVGGQYLRTPTGGWMGNGRSIEMEWGGNPQALVRLDIRMEWEAEAPTTETLRLGLRNPQALNATARFAHGAFEGSSPLDVTIIDPRVTDLGATLLLELGAAANTTPVGSATIVDQPVLLLVQETYDPCARRRDG